MLIRLAKLNNVPLINIVRRPEQVKLLKEECGCEHVLDSSADNFFDQFKELAKQLKCTYLIECVGGDLTAKLMGCLPSRSTTVLYGVLSEKPSEGFDPLLMIGRAATLESFILQSYLEK